MSMTSATDRSWLLDVRRVVVKVGSRVLVDEENRLDVEQIERLVEQIASLRARGLEVVLVSSGAVAAGLPELRLTRRPRDLPTLQAAAALGQARLIELYRTLFAARSHTVGQALLTHADLRDRPRQLNARNTLGRLIDAGALPIINENDAVAVEEIRVGDNDQLSALVAALIGAQLTILLTTTDGLLTAPPEQMGELIPHVARITHDTHAMARGKGADVAIGGMRTKLLAAEIVTRAGERMIIARGREEDVLPRLLDGEPIGTLFEPREKRLKGKQRFIAFFQHPRGTLRVDAGASAALRERGGSLLPVGVRAVEGEFNPGDPVRICDQAGVEIARGLTNYGAADARRLIGKRSDEIGAILGDCLYEEIVHRDNMATV